MCFKTKVSLLLLALFVGAGVFSMSVQPAEATSLAELQQIINELKSQIAELRTKLKSAQGQQQDGEWCHTFNGNLKYGDKGAEVIALQTAMKKQGFEKVSKDKIGTFGMYTASVIVEFQQKYAKDILAQWGLKYGTGFVGKSTRAKLNKFYGCETTPVEPSIGFGWDYNLTKRCVKTTGNPGDENYYEDVVQCEDEKHWLVAVESEKTFGESCPGPQDRSFIINGENSPVKLNWESHQSEYGENWLVNMKTDTINYSHPCGAGHFTWFAFMNQESPLPKPRELISSNTISYNDFALPDSATRCIVAAQFFWDGKAHLIEVNVASTGWGDTDDHLGVISSAKGILGGMDFVLLDGSYFGHQLQLSEDPNWKWEDTEISIDWAPLIDFSINEGYFDAPTDWNNTVTQSVQIASEVHNKAIADLRHTNLRISSKSGYGKIDSANVSNSNPKIGDTVKINYTVENIGVDDTITVLCGPGYLPEQYIFSQYLREKTYTLKNGEQKIDFCSFVVGEDLYQEQQNGKDVIGIAAGFHGKGEAKIWDQTRYEDIIIHSASITSCTDTDGGNDIYEKGTACRPSTITDGLFCKTDECASSTSLKEYYCGQGSNEGKMMSKIIACENGCVSGACIKDELTLMEGDADLNGCVSLADAELIQLYALGSVTPTPDQFKCADVNDDGVISVLDLAAVGVWLEDNSNYPLWQSPADDDMAKPVACVLVCSVLQNQTSCLDNSNCYWDQQYNNCRTYDSTKQTCFDPDNGKNIYTQAHTYGFHQTYANERDKRTRRGGRDACIGDKLREHYCVNDYYIRTYDVECPNGCENGACKRDETTPSITVTSPNGGERWKIGETYSIRWDTVGNLPIIEINLYKGGSLERRIVSALANDGGDSWIIPADVVAGDDYKIRVEGAVNGVVDEDFSDDYFSIVATETSACTDTDNGKNIFEKGTTCRPSTVTPGNLFCKTDECVSSTSLKEYYCGQGSNEGKMMSKIIACENGCVSGACKQEQEPEQGSVGLGWDYNFTKRCAKTTGNPGDENYYEDIHQCDGAGYRKLNTGSEIKVGSPTSNLGPLTRVYKINDPSSPVSIDWDQHTGDLGQNWTANLSLDLTNDLGYSNAWNAFGITDELKRDGSYFYVDPRDFITSVNMSHTNQLQGSIYPTCSRVVLLAAFYWNGKARDIELAINVTDWEDKDPNDEVIVSAKDLTVYGDYFDWLFLNGSAFGYELLDTGEKQTITVDWAEILEWLFTHKNPDGEFYLERPSNWVDTDTFGLNIFTEMHGEVKSNIQISDIRMNSKSEYGKITSINVSNSNPAIGDTVTVNYTVQNIGNEQGDILVQYGPGYLPETFLFGGYLQQKTYNLSPSQKITDSFSFVVGQDIYDKQQLGKEIVVMMTTSNTNQDGNMRLGQVKYEDITIHSTSTATCTDTDNGNNIYEKGTTCRPSTVTPGNLFCKTDECASATSLKEYYCGQGSDEGNIMSQTVACANGCADGACKQQEQKSGMIYLNNGEIKVGVNLDWGGAISEIIHNKVNMVDDNDIGRLIQVAVFDGEYDFDAKYSWNPTQAGAAKEGDVYGHGSPIIECNQSDNLIYTKTLAYDWLVDDNHNPVLTDVYFEQWVSLGVPNWPNAIKVRYKMTYFGDKNYTFAPQGFPFLALNKDFYKCIVYNGDNPWTRDGVVNLDLQLQSPGEMGVRFHPTEYWASFVDDQNFGLTLYSSEHTPSWTAIRYNIDTEPSCIDATNQFDIPVNAVEEANVYYIVGDYNDARNVVYDLHSNELQSPTSWEFNTDGDRERWFAYNDLTGFDISNGTLKTSSLGGDPYMGFQSSLDIDGTEYRNIEVRMKMSAGNNAAFFFTTLGDHEFDANKMKTFSLSPGNSFQTYTIDMSSVAEWNNTISQIRLDPTNTIADIEIDYIRLKKDTATCTDTDNGNNIYEKGTTCRPSTVTPGSLFCQTDECASATSLKEYYCGQGSNEGKMMSKIIACENGCVSGACKQQEQEQCAKEGEQVNRNPLMGSIDKQCCKGLVENKVSKSYSICEKPTEDCQACHTSDLWSWDYCSPGCKCDVGEGDCDADADCSTGYCAKNVGANYGQHSKIDVCEERQKQ